jgi:hypothetical protein
VTDLGVGFDTGFTPVICAPKKWCEQRRIFERTRRRGAQQKQKKKNEKGKKGSEQERRNKRGQGKKERKEGERLYYNSTQLAHFALNFSLYVLSTDLRAVSMAYDLRAEQRKGDSGKKYEWREEQRI